MTVQLPVCARYEHFIRFLVKRYLQADDTPEISLTKGCLFFVM